MTRSSRDEDWDFYVSTRRKIRSTIVLFVCQWCDVGSMKDLFDRGYFEEHMRINHFRNHYEVGRCFSDQTGVPIDIVDCSS